MKKTHRKLLEYYLLGNHAFIACDDAGETELIVREITMRLPQKASIILDCAGLTTSVDFSDALTRCTNSVLAKYCEEPIAQTQRPGPCLQVLNDVLADHQSQGYMLIHNIDDVISNQTTFEVEGSLREVMQFRSDLAVLIAGSRETIMTMSRHDRPFYLSFRIFWFDETHQG